jgi:hypothetical protein
MQYMATLFVAGENDTEPFLVSPNLAAGNAKEAKRLAIDWICENKPANYKAIKLWLREDGILIWSVPIQDYEAYRRMI